MRNMEPISIISEVGRMNVRVSDISILARNGISYYPVDLIKFTRIMELGNDHTIVEIKFKSDHELERAKEALSVYNKVENFIALSNGIGLEEDTSKLISKIYNHGHCYRFYEILKEVFPDAVPYKVDIRRGRYDDFILSHVVTKIGNRLYDIDGEFKLGDKGYVKILPMDEKDIEWAKHFSYSVKRSGAIPI